jgi:hypothetical protein
MWRVSEKVLRSPYYGSVPTDGWPISAFSVLDAYDRIWIDCKPGPTYRGITRLTVEQAQQLIHVLQEAIEDAASQPTD